MTDRALIHIGGWMSPLVAVFHLLLALGRATRSTLALVWIGAFLWVRAGAAMPLDDNAALAIAVVCVVVAAPRARRHRQPGAANR
jgi:hypothetical protein